MTIEQMWRARLLRRAGLRRQDGRFPINLHGISVDDDAISCFRQSQRRRRLAARGGACNKHGVMVHQASMFVLNVIGKGAAPSLFEKLGADAPVILSPNHAFDLPVTADEAPLLLAEAR